MKAAGMSWVTCSLLVLAASLAAATPANDRPGNKVDVAILDVHQLTPLETFSNGFPKEFAHNLPTHEFMGDFANAQEAREDSPGFIAGRPDSFPRFSSVGGFGPMGDLEKGNIAGNFMEEFKIPVVRIPGIREKQPQFTPLQFLNQVSVVREDSDQPESQPPHATTSFKPFSPPSTGHEEDGFKLVFPHSTASRPDPDPVPPTPSLQPSTTNDIIPITADHRPNRPPSTPGGRAKKQTKNPFGSLLNPIRDLVRPSRQRTPSLRQPFP